MKRIIDFPKMANSNDKIVMLTAYDYPSAKLAEEQNVDMILVGDSLGMVVLGYDSTIEVTVADMIHHGKAVRRGAPNTFVIVDMPFGSYHGDRYDVLKTAVDIFQQTGANALKVEGVGTTLPTIKLMIEAGIPVMGHLGLQPQQAANMGGYKVQGRTEEGVQKLIDEVHQLQDVGVFAIVFECIPTEVMTQLQAILTVPSIGIGAGPTADGQVLVYHDVLAYGSHHIAKFVKQFSNIGKEAAKGIQLYKDAVKTGDFPAEIHSFHLKKEAGK
ncbi:3-methyl-2-oxobutanoate hydroxymethyltransferase [Kurthia sibirica]|uniref:3-methyl-2-oxobutanoate hydroxymethyltransferase n=1 Tax=Kurthia sibirica TaxID=202750 RepID=A0A2U3AI66_9BACL|nr:3-methyl-2-oxobutanoate hydroxymethyltransferase [Kurthia sibirica]PWI24238.1 3-methyl-2-oxobutanoate hydroxymethyltransferase [Kurthia sibirica]GEK34137.1 3-methyl-2-oxobutanoate hydroxymethyltransferase [Kurthia sibirica]